MKPMKTIKDGWNKFTVVVKDKDYSTREAVLFAICTFLTGLVLGMLCSPRKSQTFGSYNGNCSDGGCGCDCDYGEDTAATNSTYHFPDSSSLTICPWTAVDCLLNLAG